VRLELRDLKSLDDCRAVVGLQIAVWGEDMETVPAGVLLVSAKRGGILIGAEDDGRLVGFVWSMPGWRERIPTHWSHMLAVLPEHRGRGLGAALKLEQRQRALRQGTEMIEWTFDPLQAANAHLNFVGLGTVATEYLVDAYGPMTGPLHRGTPTDRLIAEWWIRRPHVERRLAARSAVGVARSAEVLEAPRVIDTGESGDWVTAGAVLADLDARRVRVPVPPAFGEMQQRATDLALAWRLATRRALQAYLARGYRAVDFFLNRDRGGGEYLLALAEPEVDP
jgi:predicted GNAT superfamily acetyltransferase